MHKALVVAQHPGGKKALANRRNRKSGLVKRAAWGGFSGIILSLSRALEIGRLHWPDRERTQRGPASTSWANSLKSHFETISDD